MRRSLLTGSALALTLVAAACGPREQEADVPPAEAPTPAPTPITPPPAPPMDTTMRHDTTMTTTGM